ncbi:hypothetical protein VTO42DRAFT_3078 [Malbranchea cinnamomea]
MTTRKRNDFLDIGSSDDEGSDRGYDSEVAEESKGRTRSVKRRKLSEDEDLEKDSADEDAGSESEKQDGDGNDEEQEQKADGTSDHQETDAEDKSTSAEQSASTSTSTSKSEPVLKKKPKKNKTGVIYLSSLPPYLKPSALKSMLTARGFGPITKVFLTPYVPPASRHTGASSGKRNRRRMYTDGWVEFASKRTAKICAETLNATIVGGKKGGWYHDDIWNMKYLKGFKWSDLMEQVQREKREAEARRRIEDARARKEEKIFLQGVEKSKVLEGIKKKKEEKEKRKAAEGGDAEGNGGEKETSKVTKQEIRRVFKQKEVKGNHASKDDDGGGKKIDADVQRVLGKIF